MLFRRSPIASQLQTLIDVIKYHRGILRRKLWSHSGICHLSGERDRSLCSIGAAARAWQCVALAGERFRFARRIRSAAMKIHIRIPFLQKSPLAPRYWGDETGPGGIWGIYLKKVRYHPSSSYTNGESDDTVSHLEWETIKVRDINLDYFSR